VEATVVVRDSQGKTVGNLTADDFELFDSGKRQVISRFEIKKAEHRTPAGFRLGRPASAGAPPEVAVPTRFIALVVDNANLVPEQMPLAMTAAMRHLGKLSPGDRVAVRSVSGHTVLPFTSDREQLRSALSKMVSLGRRETFNVSKLNSAITCQLTYLRADWIVSGDPSSIRNCMGGSPAAPAAPVLQRPTAGAPIGIDGETARIGRENQIRNLADSIVQAGDRDVMNYFAGLGELITTMSHMPGDRTIILLSPGMYIAPRFRHLQDLLIEEAVRAHVVISAVDPRGVFIRDDPDDPSTWSDTWGLAESRDRVAFMENATSGTGGRFVRGDNDIAGALRRLDSTPEYVYVLGFSPEALKVDGKYHPLKVTLRRSHGFSVNARRGYYSAGVASDPAAAKETEVRDSFFSDLELNQPPVRLRLRSSATPASTKLIAVSHIDVGKVAFSKDLGINRVNLTLMVGVFDQNGNLMKDVWKDIDLHPTDDELLPLRQGGIEVQSEFEVPPGRYLVRAMVHEPGGRGAGTHSLGIEIRP
jgi:VWFA-related protein